MLGISLMAEQLLDSEEGFSCMEFVKLVPEINKYK
jgi:hypothetical protein